MHVNVYVSNDGENKLYNYLLACVSLCVGLVFGDRAAQTERVMNALFPADAMLLFHRVSLEMAYADNFVATQNRENPPVREIIELEDDDEEMVEVTPVNDPTGTLICVFLYGFI